MREMKRILKRYIMIIILSVFFLLIIPIVVAWIIITQPTSAKNTLSDKNVDEERLQKHVWILSEQYSPRDYTHVDKLNDCAAYILGHFKKAGARSTSIQTFLIYGREYKNIIAFFGSQSQERIVVGAHYDAVEATPGADDNASGVAGLIELAYLLGSSSVQEEIELVAYTLEEPPFFGTNHMGSAYHAELLAEDGISIKLMIALEMIGYFCDQENSQSFPLSILKWFYPNKGNFIIVVGGLAQRQITRTVKIAMKNATELPVYSINAPSLIPGIDFSDHRSYWNYGYNAIMITDTAFYRNKSYHLAGDTADRLDYKRMAQVVVGLYEAVNAL